MIFILNNWELFEKAIPKILLSNVLKNDNVLFDCGVWLGSLSTCNYYQIASNQIVKEEDEKEFSTSNLQTYTGFWSIKDRRHLEMSFRYSFIFIT